MSNHTTRPTHSILPPAPLSDNSREERECQADWLAHVQAGRIGARAAPSREVVLGRLRNELVLSGGRVTLGQVIHHPVPPVRGQGVAA